MWAVPAVLLGQFCVLGTDLVFLGENSQCPCNLHSGRMVLRGEGQGALRTVTGGCRDEVRRSSAHLNN